MSEDRKITVRIDSSRPIFIEADADSFGAIFAGVSDAEQVGIFRSMVEHMKPHRMQWDYIAIALEKDENRDVYNDLSVIFPSTHDLIAQIATKDAEIARLREALEPFALIAEHDVGESEHDDDYFASMATKYGHAPRLRVGHLRRALAALSPIPDPAGGMPVEVET